MRTLLLLLLSTSFFVTACQKEVFYEVPPITTTPGGGSGNGNGNGNNNGGNGGNASKDLITANTWVVTSSVATIDWPAPLGTQTADMFATRPTCYQDNQYIFKPDFTVNSEEGPTKCNSTDPQIISTGTWKLQDNNKKLESTTDGFTIIADILELTATTLKIRYEHSLTGIKTVTTTTYKKL